MAEYPTDGSGALQPNDPYNNMERSDTRPNLRLIDGGKSNTRPNLRAIEGGKSTSARNSLSNIEQSTAARPISAVSGGTTEARNAEQNQSFTNSVQGLNSKTEEKTKGPGFFKQKGPLIAIISLLIGGGGLMLGSQILMPFATANRIIQEFNSMKTIMNRRSDPFLKFQLDTERYKNPTTTTLFVSNKFKLSSHQLAKLNTEGITQIEVRVNGKKRRLLTFDDGSGKLQPILIKKDIKEVDADQLVVALNKVMPDAKFKGTPIDINSAFDIDGFRNGYLKSSKTWKGNIAGWFDSMVVKVIDRLGISRNRFKKWQATSDIEAGNAEFKKMAKSNNADLDNGTKRVSKVDDTDAEPDANGNRPLKDGVPESDADSKINPSDSVPEVEVKLRTKANAAANLAGESADGVCAVMAASGAISALAIAAQVAQVVDYTSGYLEAIQKVQAGDGDGSPITHYTNQLTATDKNGTTGMSASGIGALFGSGNTDTSKDSVKNFDMENSMKIIGLKMDYTMDKMMTCTYASIASKSAIMISDAIMLVGTLGVGNIIKSTVKSVVISVIIENLVSKAVEALVPQLAKIMTKDLIGDTLGEDLGNAIASGTNIYLGKNHQGGGGSPGDISTVLAYRQETASILAEEAEYDRKNRSPFDISSQNTFLGSLFYKILPLSFATNNTTSVINGFGSMLSSSLTQLLPSASAVADTRLITQQGDCPTLNALGIVGDVYCNPYYTSDLSTIDGDPGEDIYETVAANSQCGDGNFKTIWLGDFNGNGEQDCEETEVEVNEEFNPIINLSSNLGKYIIFCGQRTSQFGMADANIAASSNIINTGNSNADSVLSGGLAAVPVIGDAVGIIEDIKKGKNADWIGGQACVASNDKTINPNWKKENRYFQRYTEDQRLMESAGIIKESAVTTALNKYYKENPLDNSYEGVLARYSGMTKDQVIATIDLIDYASFIANYDATDLAPLAPNPTKKELPELIPNNLNIAAHDSSPVAYIAIYATLRERSFAT